MFQVMTRRRDRSASGSPVVKGKLLICSERLGLPIVDAPCSFFRRLDVSPAKGRGFVPLAIRSEIQKSPLRLSPRRLFGYALAVAVVALAAFLLYRTLSQYDW